MTYDNCLHGCRPGGQIDLFISLCLTCSLFHLNSLSHFDQTRLTLRDFYYCCIVVVMLFIEYKNEFPSHSDHNFYHHIQQQLPTTPPHIHDKTKWKWQEENFSIIRIKRKKKICERNEKKKKSFSFLMLLSNGVIDTWYGKKSVDGKKWKVEKIDW